jgi:hypothetical protein
MKMPQTSGKGYTYHVPFPDFMAWKDEKDASPPEHFRAYRKFQLARLAGQRSGAGWQGRSPQEIVIGMDTSAATHAIQALRADAATGNRQAMDALVGITVELVRWLERLSHRQETFIHSYARRAAEWPMMVSLHPQRVKDIRADLKRLELGAESGLAIGKRWGVSWDGTWSTATKYALTMVETIEANQRLLAEQERQSKAYPVCRFEWRKRLRTIPQWVKNCCKLPALSRGSAADAWFEIGWQALLEKTNGHPQDVPELCVLGKHREGKYARHYKAAVAGRVRNAEILTRKTSPTRTAATDIRQGIKERIYQAMQSLASSR